MNFQIWRSCINIEILHTFMVEVSNRMVTAFPSKSTQIFALTVKYHYADEELYVLFSLEAQSRTDGITKAIHP